MKYNRYSGFRATWRKRAAPSKAACKLVDIVAAAYRCPHPRQQPQPACRKVSSAIQPKIVLLNKSDMADPARTAEWVDYFATAGKPSRVPDSNCGTGRGLNRLLPGDQKHPACEQIAAWERKGMVGRPIRIMVVGVPNVGKSSLINRLCKGGSAGKAAVQDKTGRHAPQPVVHDWQGSSSLLDTTGRAVWPKFEDPVVGEHLAFTGAVRDEILDIEAYFLTACWSFCRTYIPEAVNTRYKTDIRPEEELKGHEILERIGRKRGTLYFPAAKSIPSAQPLNALDEDRGPASSGASH